MKEKIYGRNPVLEALKADVTINRILVIKENKKNMDIISKAKEQNIPIDYVDRKTLNIKSETDNHQGVLAETSEIAYVEVEDILRIAKEKNEDPLIIVCDHLEDPHNLGAIIRSAICFGAHGVVIPKKRSTSINSTVIKASAGGAIHMPIARVGNLVQTLEEFKKENIWVAGTDAEGESIVGHKGLTGPLALVIGSEGKGMSNLVKKNCDFVVSIPMTNRINSLNASVATAVVLYEIYKNRIIEE